jgi:hypothetical protein
LFPDIAKDNIHGLYPEDTEIPHFPSTSDEPSKDEDEAAGGIAPSSFSFFLFSFCNSPLL